jgi:hypothetical protein
VDRGMIELTTDNGMGPSNTIYLEVEVLEALIRYYEKAKSYKKEKVE